MYFAICEYNVVKQKEKVIIYLNIIQFLKDLYSMWRGGMMHKIVAEGQQDTLLVGVIQIYIIIKQQLLWLNKQKIKACVKVPKITAPEIETIGKANPSPCPHFHKNINLCTESQTDVLVTIAYFCLPVQMKT